MPEQLHTLFWNCDVEKLETERDKDTIILEVLARGSLEQNKILFKIYDLETVANVFRSDVQGNRTLPAPVVYLFSEIFLTREEFEEYRNWHNNPVRRWEQRRMTKATPT